MLVKVLAVVMLAVGVHMAADPRRLGSDPERLTAVGDHKDSRQLDKFFTNILTLSNKKCTGADSEAEGTCKAVSECKEEHGIEDGSCAKGFGTCCLATGSTTIGGDGGVFRSKDCHENTDNCIGAGLYTATLEPPAGTKQIMLDFHHLHLAPPIAGDCDNDTFIVVGANDGIDVPVLCGNNDGQHMYINIDNSDGPYKLLTTISDKDHERHWDVKVKYLSEFHAPAHCLQYHEDNDGDIMSFNFDLEDGMALNNHKYSICFGYIQGFCDIAMYFSRFDLGNIKGDCEDRYVSVGTAQICDDAINLMATANATAGPIHLTVMTDDMNELEELGFTGSYMNMKC